MNYIKKYLILAVSSMILLPIISSCNALKYKPVDAREVSPDPNERVRKNIEEGRGFRLMGNTNRGT